MVADQINLFGGFHELRTNGAIWREHFANFRMQ